jgi:hypothetical protein
VSDLPALTRTRVHDEPDPEPLLLVLFFAAVISALTEE